MCRVLITRRSEEVVVQLVEKEKRQGVDTKVKDSMAKCQPVSMADRHQPKSVLEAAASRMCKVYCYHSGAFCAK